MSINKKWNYIWILVALSASIFVGCNKSDLMGLEDADAMPIPIKMELQKNIIVSGDSLAIVFSVDEKVAPVANKDITISLSITDESGADASQYLIGFTDIITFPRGEKTMTKKFQLSKLQMTKLIVNLNATSETTTIANSTVSLTISNSELCKLVSLTIGEVVATVTEDNTNVHILVPTGTDVTSLLPVVEVSADATYSPHGEQDFSAPVVYTITAQDGVTSLEYTVTAEIAANTEAVIEGFILGGYVGNINQDAHTITVNVPTGTNTADLTAEVFLAVAATLEANGTTYTVTAEDGITTQDYTLTTVEKAVALKMAYVEGGTFTMGDGGAASTFEATISHDLFVGAYEITWGQYSDLLGENRASIQAWRWKPAGPTIPMTSLSWFDACDFSNQLSIAHGLEPYYSIADPVTDGTDRITSATVTINDPNGKGYRLPTEAEWEFIARGGNKSQAYVYPGGDIATEVGWVNANATKVYNNWGDPHPVGLLSANELGVYDMLGNVREWCWDWSGGDYPLLPTTDPMGPETGPQKVTRGGAFWSRPADGEMSVWDRGKPFNVSPNWNSVGFRIVRNK